MDFFFGGGGGAKGMLAPSQIIGGGGLPPSLLTPMYHDGDFMRIIRIVPSDQTGEVKSRSVIVLKVVIITNLEQKQKSA